MNDTTPVLFGAYNARFLTPDAIARTFVPSPQFKRLLKPEHSLVVGPRGSGKTTLLSMLQRQALDSWNTSEAIDLKAQVAFTGVFVPTDVSWEKQLQQLGGQGFSDPDCKLFAKAAFTSHVLRRFLIALEYELTSGSCNISDDVQSSIAAELSSAWRIGSSCKSFRTLKYALSARIGAIKHFSSEEALRGSLGRDARLAEVAMLHTSLFDAILLGIEMFNDAVSRPAAKWCLLFDELELAPEAIRLTLFSSLRSIDERLLFKLSLAPYTSDMSHTFGGVASDKNDFTLISLLFHQHESAHPFCEKLWEGMLNARGIANRSPYDVLGTSVFDTEREDWNQDSTAYSNANPKVEKFRELASKDNTFLMYLKKQRINLDSLQNLSPAKRAATLRKVTSIVEIRNEVIKTGPTDVDMSTKRSREILDIYSGAKAMFTMVEGNPRWFIAIMTDLLDQSNSCSSAITRGQQARAIANAAHRFRALLRTIPCTIDSKQSEIRGLLSLIDAAGNFFDQQLNLLEFNADPPNSFTIPSNCNDNVTVAIGLALNLGAVVQIPDKNSPSIYSNSIRGKRFRLSYIFAPHYRTLLRIGRDISLDVILKTIGRNIPVEDDSRYPLFGDDGTESKK